MRKGVAGLTPRFAFSVMPEVIAHYALLAALLRKTGNPSIAHLLHLRHVSERGSGSECEIVIEIERR
jgi:hypothetical protein